MLTVRQYESMILEGIIEEGAPFELLEGQLVRKDRATAGEDCRTVGPGHTLVVNKIGRLVDLFDSHGCHLALHAPFRILEVSEPEPDASVVEGAGTVKIRGSDLLPGRPGGRSRRR